MRRTKSFMRQKTIFCRGGEREDYREVDIFLHTKAQVMYSKRGTRAKKEKVSAPKQRNLNDKNARRYLIQLGNTNFGEDDLHISATYSNKFLPDTIEDAEREASNFLRRVGYRRNKEGKSSLKYILVTACVMKKNSEKPVRIHHHIIMNGGLDRDVIENLWRKPKKKGQKQGAKIGYINADRLQPDENGIAALCAYLKKTAKQEKTLVMFAKPGKAFLQK